jgi:hypothetical protein
MKYVQKIRRRKMNVLKLIEAHGLTLHGDIEHFAALVEAAARADERERIEKAWDKLYGWWESDDETKTRGTT